MRLCSSVSFSFLLSSLTSLWHFNALTRCPDLLDHINPAQRIRIAKGDKRSWVPFDRDDLVRIFGSPPFTRGEKLGRKVGEASAWLPLLSLYQGCRVEELAQLLIEDVQKIDGIWCLIIDDVPVASGEEKRLKNDASRRRLPLHPAVIDAGFLRFVERLRSAGKIRVFTLKADRYAKFSSGYSKAFMKYLRKDLGITHPLKVFCFAIDGTRTFYAMCAMNSMHVQLAREKYKVLCAFMHHTS
jgi:integrase